MTNFLRSKFLIILFLCVSACSTLGGGSGGAGKPGTQEDLENNVGNYVLFAVDSVSLDGDAREALDRQVRWLKEYSDVNVLVEGHCDERGTREYNVALGARRANVVRDYLIAAGIKGNRIATISYGKERPIVDGHDLEAWKQNRRAVTVVN